jgi:hypothetical protein
MADPQEPGLRLYALMRSRGAVLVATYIYALTLYVAHVAYLNPTYESAGFSYREPSRLGVLLMVCLLGVGGAMLPAVLTRPSTIIVLLLYLVVYVPTTVLTPSLDGVPLERYGLGLVMLGVGFAFVCLCARQRLPAAREGIPGKGFWLPLLVLWAICGAAIVLTYYPMMRFVGLADIYDQRAAAAEVGAGALMGYAETYFSLVFGPALLAIGLLERRWTLVALGTIGGIVMFMVSAQRTLILLPFAIIGLHLIMNTRLAIVRSTSFLIGSVAAAVGIAVSTGDDDTGSITSYIALYLVTRTIAIPGLTFSQYYDLFGEHAFTWWSHVKGMSLIVAQPVDYLVDRTWPNLGFMIGDRLFGSPTFNANANLFAADGVAAAGALGVAVIAVALALWVWLLDRASSGWNRKFALLVTLPLAVALTNGSLFTTLLSFGGLFWTLVFHFHKPGAARQTR